MTAEGNKGRGRPTRNYVSRVWRLYGSGYVQMNQLFDLINTRGGGVEIRVIRDELSEGEGSLAYAVFYKSPAGEYFDVITARNSMVKRYATAAGAASYLSTFADFCGDEFLTFSLPSLTERECIVPGQLEQEYIEKIRAKADQR